MNGFNPGVIGVPLEMMTPELLKRIYKNAPPGVMEVFNQKKADRKAEMDRVVSSLPAHAKVKRSSSGGFVALVMPKPTAEMSVTAKYEPKGSTMPAAVAPRQDLKATSPKYIVPTPTVVAPNLRAFSSPEAAYRAGMSLLAGVGRSINACHATSEQYCRERGLTVFNIASTTDPQKGGYLAPDEVSSAILVNMSRIGVARRLATLLPMTAGRITVPVELGGPTVYYISEMGATTPSDASWGEVSVEAERRGALTYISQELNGDAVVRGVDVLVDSHARALARVEDRELVLADGTSAYGGAVGLIASLGAGGIVDAASGHDS